MRLFIISTRKRAFFMPSCKGGDGMYTWLLRYIDTFGKDFPVSAVKDLTEYEIVRIIQACCKSGQEYTPGTETADSEKA